MNGRKEVVHEWLYCPFDVIPVLNVQHSYDASKLIIKDITNWELSSSDIFRQKHSSSTEAIGNNMKGCHLDPDFEGTRNGDECV